MMHRHFCICAVTPLKEQMLLCKPAAPVSYLAAVASTRSYMLHPAFTQQHLYNRFSAMHMLAVTPTEKCSTALPSPVRLYPQQAARLLPHLTLHLHAHAA
jgi:hypothetical protein